MQAAIDTMPLEDETMEPKAKKAKVATELEKDIRGEDGLEPRGIERPVSGSMETKGGDVRSVEAEGEGEEEDEGEGEGEGEDDSEDGGERHKNKRLKTGDATSSRPVEFTEDDIAWQLEAMAEEYGLDEEDLEEGEEMTEEEGVGLFKVRNLRKCSGDRDELLTLHRRCWTTTKSIHTTHGILKCRALSKIPVMFL